MFKNLWYVVAPSRQIGTAPVSVRLLGQPFVAFRDTQGRACLLSDICVHRGGALSSGTRVGDAIACPYHGWRFGPDGVCTHIPAQPGLQIPSRARVDAYPVVERYGWVWAFLGDLPDSERAPLPQLDWVDDPGFRVVSGHFDWQASWDRVMENGLDFAHAPFVHGSTFGDPDHPAIDGFEVHSSLWEGHATMTMRRPLRRGWWRRRPTGSFQQVQTRPGYHFAGPCTTLELHPRAGWTIHIVAAHVPVDAQRTRTWWMMGRSFLRSALFDASTVRANLRIFAQDHAVLRQVRPERVPDGWQEEVSVKSDGLQIAFRKRLHQLQALGWKIDEARVTQEYRGQHACAIAGPARREVKAWAIPEVPTLGPGR